MRRPRALLSYLSVYDTNNREIDRASFLWDSAVDYDLMDESLSEDLCFGADDKSINL